MRDFSHLNDKRDKYLNNKSIVLGNSCYLNKEPDKIGNFHIKDFNEKNICIIPGITDKITENLKVAKRLFEYLDYDMYCCSDLDCSDKILSRHFNIGLDNDSICYIHGTSQEELNKD